MGLIYLLSSTCDECKSSQIGADGKSDSDISADGHNVWCNRIWRAIYALLETNLLFALKTPVLLHP